MVEGQFDCLELSVYEMKRAKKKAFQAEKNVELSTKWITKTKIFIFTQSILCKVEAEGVITLSSTSNEEVQKPLRLSSHLKFELG